MSTSLPTVPEDGDGEGQEPRGLAHEVCEVVGERAERAEREHGGEVQGLDGHQPDRLRVRLYWVRVRVCVWGGGARIR